MLSFIEFAPENWLGVGGASGKALRALTERYPSAAHGLSLSLGGPDALDITLLQRVKGLLDTHGVGCYSEHLSYTAADGHLYDLMPIPFTSEAVNYVAARIRTAQEILQRRIAIENVSYYAAPGQELSEHDFLNAVLTEADCDLLLDVNNVYVNSTNHGYDADAFIAGLPAPRIAYCHIAGHDRAAADLLIDSHGASVAAPVWRLLQATYARCGALPTAVERDFNIPPLSALYAELATLSSVQTAHQPRC